MPGKKWFFVVGTCSALSQYTGVTDCDQDSAYQLTFFKDYLLYIKTATQFFSAKTYLSNNEETSTRFSINQFRLSSFNAYSVNFGVSKIQNSFSRNAFYNDQLLQSVGSTETITTYDIKEGVMFATPYSDFENSYPELKVEGTGIYQPFSMMFDQ